VTGTSIRVFGEIVESPGREQSVELAASDIEILGECPAEVSDFSRFFKYFAIVLSNPEKRTFN